MKWCKKTNTRPKRKENPPRQSSPIHLNRVLIKPVLGDPKMVHATPATTGGANSGRILAAAIKPLNGVLARTTIQEKNSPIATEISAPPPQPISECGTPPAT